MPNVLLGNSLFSLTGKCLITRGKIRDSHSLADLKKENQFRWFGLAQLGRALSRGRVEVRRRFLRYLRSFSLNPTRF